MEKGLLGPLQDALTERPAESRAEAAAESGAPAGEAPKVEAGKPAAGESKPAAAEPAKIFRPTKPGGAVRVRGAEPDGEHLADLARTVRDTRAAVDDPRLSGVLDEIELRARVELAKLEAIA